MNSREFLEHFLRETSDDFQLIVVSNREPYTPVYSDHGISWTMPPGGLTAALDPVMRVAGGVWIAQRDYDPEEETVGLDNTVGVPPEDPKYLMRSVLLSEQEKWDYYSGFSNMALWPLCHTAYVRPRFVEDHWNAYKLVNQKFADAVLEQARGENTLVFVQDYHLALVPRLIKQQEPSIRVGQFWHIPWPHWETFRTCPWENELVNGLLGNDLLGFHVEEYCKNFMDTVEMSTGARLYGEGSLSRAGLTRVLPFPISVDFEQLNHDAQEESVEKEMDRLKDNLNLEGKLVGMGLDRLDYTKGLLERLAAIEEFFSTFHEFLGKVVFVQVSSPTRTSIKEYRQFVKWIDDKTEEINDRFASREWTPIVRLENASPTTIMALRRLSHFSVVSSLHDGLNIVAKEYVASRFDEDGVLILSKFTGAAKELQDALIVNPYDVKGMAGAIRDALTMPEWERKIRMRRMRRVVRENNVYDWAFGILSEILGMKAYDLFETPAAELARHRL